jgi:hypothetical protein
MLGSEDVIRIVNDPPGTFQIRGIMFEELLGELRSNPDVPTSELGKKAVDSFIEQYQKDTIIPGGDGKEISMRYSGGLSLVRCDNYGKLAGRLDDRASKFSQDTSWDEMIDLFRRKMGVFYPDILIDRCQRALRDSDFLSFCETNPKIPWALRKSVMKADWRPVMRYLDLLATLDPKQRPLNALIFLRDFLSTLEERDERAIHAIMRLNGILNS